jgi:hypothetical protein
VWGEQWGGDMVGGGCLCVSVREVRTVGRAFGWHGDACMQLRMHGAVCMCMAHAGMAAGGVGSVCGESSGEETWWGVGTCECQRCGYRPWEWLF